MDENEKVCAVCFSRMGDLAAEEIAEQSFEEILAKNNDEDWSDMSESEEEFYTEQKKLRSKKGISVGSECVQCGVVICHDCLVDWTVTTVNQIHVPETEEAQKSNDWFSLKCSSSACEKKYTISEIEGILGPRKFEPVSSALSKRVIQSN